MIDDEGNIITEPYNYVRLGESNQVDGTLISEISEGKDEVKIKLTDKMKALDFLTKNCNLLSDEAWKSSDESVATVDSNGKVTGIKAGQAAVTATTAYGSNLSSSCTVNVKDVSPTVVSLSVTPEKANVIPGEQQQ